MVNSQQWSEIEQNNQDLVISNAVTSELYRQCDRPAIAGTPERTGRSHRRGK
ncbi:hypothetical protein [Microcoleus sp.]|uniref:hypothetical protein n=1 Tax=Microcoleus sp. TaxID=44472 RepID=UPI00403E4763